MTKSPLLILFAISTLIASSCQDKSAIKLDYCRMLELDQSHVNTGNSEKEKLDLDRKARHEIFKNNFNEIIQYSKVNGFPEMGSLKSSGLDSCRNWVVMITLFHVGQSQPQLFFEEEAKQVLAKEIAEGRLKSGSLFPPLREGFKNHEFCLVDKSDIRKAVNSWGLKIEELPGVNFIDCSK